MGVHPDYQGQGYGTLLMKHALQVFRNHGTYRVGLYVGAKNEPAIRLYRKFGFEVLHESWQYVLHVEQFENHKEIHHKDVHIRELSIVDIDDIIDTFPDQERDRLQDWMSNPGPNLFFGVLDPDLKLFARFNPDFSGCFPFEVTDLTYADVFVDYLIKTYKQQDRDSIRLGTNATLAQHFEENGYEQHKQFRSSPRLYLQSLYRYSPR